MGLRRIVLSGILSFAFAFADAIEEGRFAQAYEQGLKLGGVSGWVLAARAANFYASYQARGDSEIMTWFEQAEEAANKALQANPRSAEAHFELARAYGGQLAKRNLLTKASLAGSMRDQLGEALRLKPDMVEAKVALAIWHLEVAESGLGWLYGADVNRVRPLFEEALRADPNSITTRNYYALALERLGDSAAARAQLEKALALTPRDAVERYEQGYARDRLQNFK